MKFNKQKIYIWLFAILYLCVAFVSTFHAIAFFGLANSSFLSIILAITFEIGQAAVLFSLLTKKKETSRFIPWILMCILTLVQVIGNVFSSYKYLMLNAGNDLQYFKDPIFMWTELPDAQCNVILSYVIGAILPIVSLLMTAMVTDNLEEDTETPKQETKTVEDEIKDNKEIQIVEETVKQDEESKPVEVTQIIDEKPIETQEIQQENNSSGFVNIKR